MALRRRQPVGIELVKKGIVSEDDIRKALEHQKKYPNKKIGEIIYMLGIVEPSALINALGEIVGEKGIIISKDDISINVPDYISIDMAKEKKILPFSIEGDKIKVCFADTENISVIESTRLLMMNKGYIMERYITFEDIIINILDSLQQHKFENYKVDFGGDTAGIIDTLIKEGIKRRASDIHFEPQDKEVVVRYRIDGKLITYAKLDKIKQPQIIGRLKSISNMHQEKQESQDGRILDYEGYNIRASSQKNIYGEKFVLRILKKNADIQTMESLGLSIDEEQFHRDINKRNAITIVAAPTGEGKTTTLYSIIDKLNRPDINITTIEDPVEIRIPGLNQIEIDMKTSFSGALRTVLRQDPDIILVGEIRDKETAEIAIQSGQTGHYVLSTIHTVDAIEVITRLRKIGLADYDIATTLSTSISQRLVRRICPKCHKVREFNEKEKEVINSISKKYDIEFNLEGKKTYDAVGCEYCHNSGYYGRIGIFEILHITDEIKEFIMNGESSIQIRKFALKETDYRPLVIDGIEKVLQGITNLDEINDKLSIF